MANEEYRRRFQLAEYTEKWAVTMTKVCIRRAVASRPWPRWHFLSFSGPDGGESRGVQVGAICLSCGHRQGKMIEFGIFRHFPPVEWDSASLIDLPHLATAFEEMLNRAT